MATTFTSDQKDLQSSIAMYILMISWAMFFGTLLLAYFILRNQVAVWPPMGFNRIDLLLPTVSTVIIGLSSLSFWHFEKSKKILSLITTFVLGLGFMLSQTLLWNEMEASGLFVQDGVFPTVMYSFTWIHAAHIVLGLICLAYAFLIRKREQPLERTYKNIGWFWHFLGIIWLVMYLSLFVF